MNHWKRTCVHEREAAAAGPDPTPSKAMPRDSLSPQRGEGRGEGCEGLRLSTRGASPAPPQALVFDCDGTLADTMPLHWQVWQTLLRRYGLQMSEERFYALGGVPSRDIARKLAEEQGIAIDPLALAREKEARYLDLLAHVAPIEMVVQIAREHAGRLPMAVASGGTRRVIELVLRHLGIRDLFAAVVTNEDVTRQKPAPDIFLEAARRLGVPPHRCRAYEDTDLGLEAIRAAGMEAVDVRALLA